MIERADSNGDGQVSFDDFFNIMTKKTFAWLGAKEPRKLTKCIL